MIDGFFNIDKPDGVTSQLIDRTVRRELNAKRVGHAGTLDPFASGVLPIAVGRATKFIDFLPNDKSYRAEIFFGRATDTADRTGQTIAQFENFSMPTVEQIETTLQSFVGELEQTPPKFSAIKLNGRKAYELARRSLNFDIPTRRVTIDRIELVSLEGRSVVIDVDCRKGTYIRSLAIDIGRTLGLPTMLNELRRTRSNGFSIEQSIPIDNLRAEQFIPVEQCLTHLPLFELPEHRRKAFLNGLPTDLQSIDNACVRVNCHGEFLGTGSIVDGQLKPLKLFLI